MVTQKVKNELFAGVYFDESLDSLGLDEYRYLSSDNNEDRKFVFGTSGRRGSPMISSSDGSSLLCVYDTLNTDSPFDEPTMVSLDTIEEHLPRKLQNSHCKPYLSLKGEYLKVMEWTGREKEDGKNILRCRSQSSRWIPVEWVRQRVRYEGDTEYRP